MKKDGIHSSGARSSRLERLQRLALVLQRHPGLPAGELAARTGTSVRNLFRDIAALRAAGYLVCPAKPHGYRIEDSGQRVPARLSLTEDELLALHLHSKFVAQDAEQPLSRAFLDAVDKITRQEEQARRVRLRRFVQDSLNCVSIQFDARDNPASNSTDAFYAFHRAIRRQHVCEVDYEPTRMLGRVMIEFEPYHLYFREKSWYVLGMSRTHRGMRLLKIRRVRAVRSTGIEFAKPPVDTEEFFKSAWSVVRGGQEREVAVLVSPKLSQTLVEMKWHDSQREHNLKDGGLILTFTVGSLDEIMWWVLGYGDEITVLKPLELRNRVQLLAQRTAQHHKRVPPTISVKPRSIKLTSETEAYFENPA